jgi:hypothetical protein
MELSEEVFLQTHYPMKFLVKDAMKKEIEFDEEQLIRRILSSHSGNRIFLLIGDTGTGKSEFCLYLKYRAAKENIGLVPIHIPKYKLSLEKIVAIILSHLEDGKKYRTEFRARKLSAEQAPNISNLLISQVFIESVPGLSEETKAKINASVSKKVEHRIRQYLEMPPEGTEREPEAFTLIDESELDEILSFHNLKIRDPKLAYKYLREKLSKEFREYLRLPDLSALLEKISEDFKSRKKRPLLIVDDIVTLGPMVYDFLDFLSTLEAGDWDAVIGVTSGKTELLEKSREAYEEIKGMETLRERSTEIYLTRGQESTFLTVDNCVDFIKPYLQLTKNCSECKDRKSCMSLEGQELYPFNKVFLKRMFQCSEKRTPRQFVLLVKDVLATCQEDTPPYQLTKQLSLYTSITIRRRMSELNPSLADCALWYGELSEDGRYLVLKKPLTELFNFSIPKEVVSIHEDQVFVPIIPLPEIITREKRPEKVSVEEEEEQEDLLIDVKKWLEGENIFPHKESLRRGIFEVMKRLRAFEMLKGLSLSKDAGFIGWDKQFQGLPIPIVIEGADDVPPHPHIIITRKILGDHAHALALSGYLFLRNAPNAEENFRKLVIRLNINIFHTLGKDFSHQILKHISESIPFPSETPLENWILVSYILCTSVLNGLGMPSYGDIKQSLLKGKIAVSQPWLTNYELPKTKDFVGFSRIYEKLFKSFFTFRRSTINYTKVEEVLTAFDEISFLGHVGGIRGDNISDYYKIDSKNLRDTVMLASDAAKELLTFDYIKDLSLKRDQLKNLLAEFENLTYAEIEQLIKEFTSLLSMSPVWLKRNVSDLLEYTQQNKNALLKAEEFSEKVKMTLSMSVDGPLTFFAFLRNFNEIQTHVIYNLFERLSSLFEEIEEMNVPQIEDFKTLQPIFAEIRKMQQEASIVE